MTRDTDANVDGNADGRVLDAAELDITDDERVRELDDGRYVVSTDGPPNVPDAAPAPDDGTPADDVAGRERSDRAIRERILRALAATDSTYAVELTAVADGTPTSERVVTDDVVSGFERLLEWYASAVGGETPPDEVLGILLAEADVPVAFPPSALEDLAAEHGLSTEDSIADFAAALRDVDGDRDVLDSQG